MVRDDSTRLHGPVRATAIVLAALALFALAGCTKPAPSATGPNPATAATSAVEATGASTHATASAWPATVGTFAREFKKPVWFPTYLPAGYKLDSTYLIEFAPGGDLMCEVIWMNGDNTLVFDQGSPVGRDYPIVSTGKVAWGSAGDTADTMLSDTTDPQSPPMIVFSKDGSLMELQGDPGIEELKKVAAGMKLLK